ncbi:AAA family ATPase [Aliarcobacter butzleri]|uniref:AAA family ATPase n=1 Tax=Aliarcobacter butzleri TaxID=28197 RepID=UPI002B24C517|nr:AAA family ATPase [Aliarcobacter butzleri]
MELVYLWVEKYKNIEKQGFNFSPRFRCEYDEDKKELNIVDKEETGEFYPKNFFGENINVTAIVGENGSGKTTIQSLLNIICSKINIDLGIKYILLTSINNHIHYQSNFDFKKQNTLIENIHNISVLTYLNSIEEKNIQEENSQLMYNDKINSIKLSNYEINQLMTMHIQENQPFIETPFFYFPAKIIIKPKDFSELFEQIIYYEGKEISNSLELLELFEDISNEYHKFLVLFNIENSIYEIEKLNDIKYLEEEFKKKEFYLTREEYEIFFTEKEINLNFLDKKEKDFYIYTFNDYFEIDYIDSKKRNWNSLSTGEQMYFGIFLNLYFFYRTAENFQNNLLITFDEIELCLHPNWQKRFLIETIYFMKQFNNKFNVIISTHSPFILSDLPKETIIFLEKGKQVYPFEDGKQTFGANIHTLLSHGFFMKDGLMGEFAKEKINSIISYREELLKKELTKNENKKQKDEEKEVYEKEYKNKFWQIQSIIGDDYLKQVIKNHLIEIEKIVLGNDKAKKEEIKRLKAQIELLEK